MPQATDRRPTTSTLDVPPAAHFARVELVTAPPRPATRRVNVVGLLVLASVAGGLLLRGHAYARNPSLWIDEAMLALNVVHRTPAGLLEPLDLNQGAPVGFLLLSKLAVQAAGPGEYALRFVPLLASLVAVPLFVLFAYRALPLPAARLAVVLFALSGHLIGYAAEIKQYGPDATVAVGLLLLVLPVWQNEAGVGRLVAVAAAGAAAVWFSHPAAFVLGGVGSAMLADAVARGDRVALRNRGLAVAAWAASFAACYLLILRHLGTNGFLLTYWAGTFLPLPPTRPGDIAWLIHHYLELFNKPGGFDGGVGMAGLAGTAALVGGLSLARTDWRTLAALVVPLALALAASGLRKYPFAGRLMLFAVPALIALVAAGLVVLAEAVSGRVRGAGAAVIGAALAGVAFECNEVWKKPLHNEDTRELVARCHAEFRPGDRVYVYYGAAPAFAYYRRQYPFPPDAVTVGGECRGKDPRHFRDDLRAAARPGRLWVVVAHRQTPEESTLWAYLDGMGPTDVVLRADDAVLMRCDCR